MPLHAEAREILARGSVEAVRELMVAFQNGNWEGYFEWLDGRDEIDGHLEARELLLARAGKQVAEGDCFRCWALELHGLAERLEDKLWDRWHGQESFSV